MTRFSKWGVPLVVVIASIAFQYVGLAWASGFASGAAMVMLQINLLLVKETAP